MQKQAMRVACSPSTESQPSPAQQVNDLFGSLEIAKAVETQAFKDFLDHVPIAIVVSKRLGDENRIVYANKCFEQKSRYACEDVIGRDWSILDAFRNEDDANLTIGDALLSGDEFLGTFIEMEPAELLCEVHVGRFRNENDSVNYHIVVLVDVTARNRAQREEFTRQMQEKDLLLKEIEHRVKNNLQLITVLIRLEARSERLGEKVNLERLAGRIEAMQFLYKELSANDQDKRVDLAHYLSQIASGVMRAHGVDGIQLDLRVENACVSINLAMPIGLVVNELLTNAFKYAFADRLGGTIMLHCLRAGGDRYQIMVRDNGAGFPPGVRWPVQGKLSALIIQTLRENAETDVQFESAPGIGTRVTITVAHGNITGSLDDRPLAPPRDH